jgi:hypothetical protein
MNTQNIIDSTGIHLGNLGDTLKFKLGVIGDTIKRNWNLHGDDPWGVYVNRNDDMYFTPSTDLHWDKLAETGGKVGIGERPVAMAARYPLTSGALGVGTVAGGYLASRFLGDGEGNGYVMTEGYATPGYGMPPGYAVDSTGQMVPDMSVPVPPLSAEELAYQERRARQNVVMNSATLRQIEEWKRQQGQYQ